MYFDSNCGTGKEGILEIRTVNELNGIIMAQCDTSIDHFLRPSLHLRISSIF